MIRVRCPGCQQKLVVKEATAGAVATCPACKQRFRIPAPRPQVQPQPDAHSPWQATPPTKSFVQSAAKPELMTVLPVDESDGPGDMDERIDSDGVPVARRRQRPPIDDEEPVTVARPRKPVPVKDEVTDEAPADEERPVARPRKRALVKDEVSDEPHEVRPVKRRKKRPPKKRKHPDDISTGMVLAVIGGVMFLVWIGVAALVVFVPSTSLAVWWLTLIGSAICGSIVRYFARQEGISERLMVMFIPFYDIYFAIRYPHAAGAVVAQYFSILILFTVGVLRFTHDLGQAGTQGQ